MKSKVFRQNRLACMSGGVSCRSQSRRWQAETQSCCSSRRRLLRSSSFSSLPLSQAKRRIGKSQMRIRSGEGDDQNILSSKDEQELEWKVATVVENRSATVDGNLRSVFIYNFLFGFQNTKLLFCLSFRINRTLVLSIQENVRQFKGRRFGKIPSLERLESPRWIDAFNTPGQYMYVRCGGDDDNDKCVWTDRERICLSSTPYDAHKVRHCDFLTHSIGSSVTVPNTTN